jgi:hypothetical protein
MRDALPGKTLALLPLAVTASWMYAKAKVVMMEI